MKMPLSIVAFLVVVVTVPEVAIAEEASDASELHETDEQEADIYELDRDDDEPEEHMPARDELTPDQLNKLHAKMDADANGKLSLDEMLQFSSETQKAAAAKEGNGFMAEIDSDKDGKASWEEMQTHMHPSDEDVEHEEDAAQRNLYKTSDQKKFKAADGDGDGLLDERELVAFFYPEIDGKVLQVAAQHTLEEKDHDNDGLLTFDEFMGRPVVGQSNSDAAEGGPDEWDEQTFKFLDKDGSGKLDLKELFAWESGHVGIGRTMESFLKLADADSDQHVTVEELHAAHEKEEHDARFHFMSMVEHHEL